MSRTRWPSIFLVALLMLTACAASPAASESEGNQSSATPEASEAEGSAPAESAAETSEPEPASIRVGVHWTYDVADWAGLVLADERGYFEDENLDVEIVYLQGSNAVVPAVGQGDVQIGLAGPDSILAGVSQGLPLTVVANHLQNSAAGVIVPADSGVTDFAGLEGLSISTAAASPEQALLAVALGDAGLDPESDVELVFVDAQAKCTVTIAGQTDACTGQNNFQAIQFEDEGIEPTFLSFSTEERPVLGASTFVNSDFLQDNGDVVRRFLNATYRGWQDVVAEDVDSIVDVFTERRPETDGPFLRKTLEVTVDSLLFSPRTEENGWGWMTDDAWQTLHDALLDVEVIAEPVDISSLYTNDYLPENAEFARP